MPYQKFIDFQGDFKRPISSKNIEKMKKSLKKHGIFVPKFVWFDNQQAYILDGHQTKKVLTLLEDEGWEIPEIPYVEIDAVDEKSAAEKMLQINSQYAEINIESIWLGEFGFDKEELLETVAIPGLLESLKIEATDYNFSDLDNEVMKMGDIVEEKIVILIPPKHRKNVEMWLANGEQNTGVGRGRGVLKRCGLL